MASRCFWDNETDHYAFETFKNVSEEWVFSVEICCTGWVFGMTSSLHESLGYTNWQPADVHATWLGTLQPALYGDLSRHVLRLVGVSAGLCA
jgi:hypothetical protein